MEVICRSKLLFMYRVEETREMFPQLNDRHGRKGNGAMVDKFAKFMSPSGHRYHPVLLHGDLWVHNLLFKSEPIEVHKKNSSEHPIQRC